MYLHQILLMHNLMTKLLKFDQFNGKQDLGKSIYIYAYIIKLLMLGYVIIVGKDDTPEHLQ